MATESTSTAAMPPMMYGTAWKKERTADLVYEAIKAGFRGIDTAAMKRHYDEALVGEGIRRAINEGIVSRKDLFIQTKITPYDTTSAYNPSDPIPTQITTSITSSLTNLSTPDSPPYLDALLLHSPYPTIPETLLALQTLQSYLPSSSNPSPHSGKILRLGLSNTTLPLLQSLPPPRTLSLSIIQNRFCASEHAFDRALRAWCLEQKQQEAGGVTYQGFWTLTGNVGIWKKAWFVKELAEAAGIELAAAWYVLARSVGVVVLNGTGDPGHMRGDLEAWGRVEEWRGREGAEEVWGRCVEGFRELVG